MLERADPISRLLDTDSRTVIYKRTVGSVTTQWELSAAVGRTRYPAMTEDGLVYRATVRDYLFAYDTFPAMPPQLNDVILDGAEQWLVVHVEGEGPYRLTGNLLRVHARLV